MSDTDRAVEAGLREARKLILAELVKGGPPLTLGGRILATLDAALASSRPAAPDSPDQLREALVPVIHEMYVDGTLEPTATVTLSEIVDRIIAALRESTSGSRDSEAGR